MKDVVVYVILKQLSYFSSRFYNRFILTLNGWRLRLFTKFSTKLFALCFTLLSVFLLYILYEYLIYISNCNVSENRCIYIYIYIYCNLKMYIKYLHLFFPYQKGNWQCMYLSHPRKQYLFCYFNRSYCSFLLKHCPFNLFLETPFLMEKEKVCIFNINFQIAMFLKTGVHVYTVAVLFAV